MLPKRQRFRRSDFPTTRSRRIGFPLGTVAFSPGELKAAVVVSKKVAPQAVSRNKLRRRIYAVLRFAIAEGVLTRAVVVYPNKKALSVSFAELKTALVRALSDC